MPMWLYLLCVLAISLTAVGFTVFSQSYLKTPKAPLDPPNRKRAAKRWNERVKLVSTSLNTIALTILGASFLLPQINQALLTPAPALGWIPISAALHLIAHAALGLLRSEE